MRRWGPGPPRRLRVRVRTDGGVVEFVAPVAAGHGAPVIDVADVLADLGAPVAA